MSDRIPNIISQPELKLTLDRSAERILLTTEEYQDIWPEKIKMPYFTMSFLVIRFYPEFGNEHILFKLTTTNEICLYQRMTSTIRDTLPEREIWEKKTLYRNNITKNYISIA